MSKELIENKNPVYKKGFVKVMNALMTMQKLKIIGLYLKSKTDKM